MAPCTNCIHSSKSNTSQCSSRNIDQFGMMAYIGHCKAQDDCYSMDNSYRYLSMANRLDITVRIDYIFLGCRHNHLCIACSIEHRMAECRLGMRYRKLGIVASMGSILCRVNMIFGIEMMMIVMSLCLCRIGCPCCRMMDKLGMRYRLGN